MTYTDKHIVETYSDLFEGLSSISKIELIENLSKSLKPIKKPENLTSTNPLVHLLQLSQQKK